MTEATTPFRARHKLLIAALGTTSLSLGAVGVAWATNDAAPSPAPAVSVDHRTTQAPPTTEAPEAPDPGEAPETPEAPDAGEAPETEQPDSAEEVDGVDCEDGIDAATGAECDGGPAANPTGDDGAEEAG